MIEESTAKKSTFPDLADEFLNIIGKRKLYPPLNSYSVFLQGSEYNSEKYFKKWYDNQVKMDLFIHIKEGFSQVWLPEDDIKGTSNFVFKEYLKDPSKVEKRIDYITESTKEIDAIYVANTYSEIQKKKWNDLLELVQRTRDIIWDVNASVLFSVYLDKTMCQKILLQENFPLSENELDAIWEKATEPAFESFDKSQLIEFLSLSANGLEWNALVEHCQYMCTDYHSAKTLGETEKAIKEKYPEYIANPAASKVVLSKEKEEIGKMISQHEAWMDTLPPNERSIAHYLQTVMKVRDRRKNFFAKGMAVMYRIAERMLEEKGLKREFIPYYSVKELLKGPEHLEAVATELEKRKSGFQWFVPYEGEPKGLCIDIQSGVNKINDYFKNGHLSEGEAGTIKGQTACKGKVSGKARIVLDVNSDHGFEEGDILVAGMTRPEYVPLMKKAAAIITDEGGITCHAAIISRELNKPCIIGTKIVTKFLKDGDMVEVDADRGIVTILA